MNFVEDIEGYISVWLFMALWNSVKWISSFLTSVGNWSVTITKQFSRPLLPNKENENVNTSSFHNWIIKNYCSINHHRSYSCHSTFLWFNQRVIITFYLDLLLIINLFLNVYSQLNDLSLINEESDSHYSDAWLSIICLLLYFFFFFENRMFDDKRIDWSQVRPVLPAKALRNSDENGRQRPPLASLLNNCGKSPISRLKWTKPNEN